MPPRKSTLIRRQEILAAALSVIADKGVSGLTISELAGRAGMSDANIYRHFKAGKQEVLLAITDFIGEEIMVRAGTVATGGGSALARLRKIFVAHAGLVAANPGVPRFMFSEEVHLGDRRLGEKMSARMGEYVSILAGLCREGIEAGVLRPGLVPRETAITMLGMIQFTALRWSVSRGSVLIEEEAERLWENFALLVTADSGSVAGA
ncbi:MAG: TetR/AcrR family transcriptional regulator [Thermodesulfobacteriota bacterium]